MRSLLASVVIATRDRPKKLAETLRALGRQSVPGERYEILVVDDGSSPPLAEPATEEAFAPRLLRVEGVGRSAARNHGARAAAGELLVFVDDDIRVREDFLEAHLAAHAEWPAALLTGAVRLPDAASRTPFGRFRLRLEEGGLPQARGVGLAPNFAAVGNLSVPRSAFLELGGFDSALRSGEDQDLALRHTARGGLTGYLPEALGIHADDALDVRSYCGRMEWGYEHILAFCLKHPDWPENRERLQVNGPIRWTHASPRAIAGRLAKRGLALGPVAALAFGAIALAERLAPSSPLLDRGYRLLLGAHLLKGFRRGLRRYGKSGMGGACS